jgi:hypothetical protein
VVTYIVTAQDNVDGTATLDENNILTQENAAVYANVDNTNENTAIAPDTALAPFGGIITIACDPPSPIKFDGLIGDAVIRDSASAYNAIPIQCTATDSAGNEATESFSVTVNPPQGDITGTVENRTSTDSFGGDSFNPDPPPTIDDSFDTREEEGAAEADD